MKPVKQRYLGWAERGGGGVGKAVPSLICGRNRTTEDVTNPGRLGMISLEGF